MSSVALRQYKAGGEFVVNQPLDWHGHVYATGDKFPWRDLGVHEVKVHELWRANILDCADPSTHANRLEVAALAAASAPIVVVDATMTKPVVVEVKRKK